MSSPTFLEYVKNSMPNETNNYQAVMFKACIESGFNDDIREGKSKPSAANPPVVSTKELREKLILSNLEKPNFDVNEALKSLQSSDIPYVSIGKESLLRELVRPARIEPAILTTLSERYFTSSLILIGVFLMREKRGTLQEKFNW